MCGDLLSSIGLKPASLAQSIERQCGYLQVAGGPVAHVSIVSLHFVLVLMFSLFSALRLATPVPPTCCALGYAEVSKDPSLGLSLVDSLFSSLVPSRWQDGTAEGDKFAWVNDASLGMLAAR